MCSLFQSHCGTATEIFPKIQPQFTTICDLERYKSLGVERGRRETLVIFSKFLFFYKQRLNLFNSLNFKTFSFGFGQMSVKTPIEVFSAIFYLLFVEQNVFCIFASTLTCSHSFLFLFLPSEKFSSAHLQFDTRQVDLCFSLNLNFLSIHLKEKKC